MSWFTVEDEQAFINKEFDSMASAIILINQENQVLLNLRDNKPEILYPDYWSIIGGGIDRGESPIDAVIREVKEEIEYDIENAIFYTKRVNTNQIVYFFTKEINASLTDFELNEGVDLKFFDKNEIKDLKIPPFIKTVIMDYFKI